MSLYKDASLVMIPSAYKDGKLYSIRPTDGDGDFTFSRGSNLAATRVDVNGLIEKGRENLLLQSNQFDTTWIPTDLTLTGNQSGYDGSSDAWLLDVTSGTCCQQLRQSVSCSGVNTFSVYVKSGTAEGCLVFGLGSGNPYAEFDLITGTTGSLYATAFDSKIESVGGGWYRCSMSFTGSITQVRIYPADASGGISQTSGNIYIQDAQLEQGLVATDYIETGTSAAQSGILEDMPRLDYSGSCPALLLEPQRTNLLNHGEYFGAWTLNAGGTGSTPVLEPNTTDTLSPEGRYNAYKVTLDAGSGTTSSDESIMYRSKSGLTAGSNHTASVYLKGAIGGEEVIVRDTEGSYKKWTLTTEWARYDYTQVAAASSYATSFGIRQGVVGTINSDAVVYMFGFQSELGSYPTSYIPTYGTSQTRSVDGGYTPTQDELTSYCVLVDLENLNDGGGSARFVDKTIADISTHGGIYLKSGAQIGYYSANSGYLSNALNVADGARHKYLIRATNGLIEEFFDGTKQTDTGTNSSDKFDGLRLLPSNQNASIHQLLVFPTALTDSECIALTSI